MFKKVLLLSIAIAATTFSYGQKAKLREANRELNAGIEARTILNKEKELTAFKKAKEAIDLAVDNEPTSSDAKAWLTKANIYINMQEMEDYQNEDLYTDALSAIKKAKELDSKLEKDDQVTILMFKAGIAAFNKGITAYNESKYQESYNSFHSVMDALGKTKSDKFSKYPTADTVRAQAKMLLGYDAYYLDKNEEAITVLNDASQEPLLQNQPNIYLVLYQAYEKSGNKEKQLSTIQEGLKKYPNDENISRLELNYYIESGNQSEMVKKLEEAVAADPENSELHFNLGIIYAEMAQPTETGKYPENAEEYNAKAEKAYQKTVDIDQNDGKFNYQFGAFYFNRAVEFNKEMNELGINEKTKSDQLAQKRDEYFGKAIPYLEKSRTIYNKKAANLDNREKTFYTQGLQALSRIYATQNELEKANEMRLELEGIN